MVIESSQPRKRGRPRIHPIEETKPAPCKDFTTVHSSKTRIIEGRKYIFQTGPCVDSMILASLRGN